MYGMCVKALCAGGSQRRGNIATGPLRLLKWVTDFGWLSVPSPAVGLKAGGEFDFVSR